MWHRKQENKPHDPKNPPIIWNLSPILNKCLNSKGFNDTLIAEVEGFLILCSTPKAHYEYHDNNHKQHGRGMMARYASESSSFSADFGPCDIRTLFDLKNNGIYYGKHTVVHDTPLASKLLDIRDGGLNIALHGQRKSESRSIRNIDDDSDDEPTPVMNWRAPKKKKNKIVDSLFGDSDDEDDLFGPAISIFDDSDDFNDLFSAKPKPKKRKENTDDELGAPKKKKKTIAGLFDPFFDGAIKKECGEKKDKDMDHEPTPVLATMKSYTTRSRISSPQDLLSTKSKPKRRVENQSLFGDKVSGDKPKKQKKAMEADSMFDDSDDGLFSKPRGFLRFKATHSNQTHLFHLRFFKRLETSSVDKHTKRLRCFVVGSTIVLFEHGTYEYHGKHGDCNETDNVSFYASPLTDELIQNLNSALAKLLKYIAESPKNIQRGNPVHVLQRYIGTENWPFKLIYQLKKTYSRNEPAALFW